MARQGRPPQPPEERQTARLEIRMTATVLELIEAGGAVRLLHGLETCWYGPRSGPQSNEAESGGIEPSPFCGSLRERIRPMRRPRRGPLSGKEQTLILLVGARMNFTALPPLRQPVLSFHAELRGGNQSHSVPRYASH
jgi:hypothetical protein